jgi:hypothetical protein
MITQWCQGISAFRLRPRRKRDREAAFLLPAAFGAWRSLVAHLLWEQGVGGSNPLAPTNKFNKLNQLLANPPSTFAFNRRWGDASVSESANWRCQSALCRNVLPGDRYALTYVPGEGTRLSRNGEVLGSIPGDDFARAVFSIRLGVNPIDKAFRDRLLGVS